MKKQTVEDLVGPGVMPFDVIRLERTKRCLRIEFSYGGEAVCWFDVPPLAVGEMWVLPELIGGVPYKLLEA